nr:uncharacterized protein LOC117861642 isoform X1 [Setaria viridis]
MIAFLLSYGSANTVVIYMLPRIRSDSDTEKPSEKEVRPHTVLGDSAFLGIHVLWVFVLRTTVGDLLKSFSLLKGFSTGGIGSVILDGGVLGFEFLYCFIVIPTLALRTRKMSRIRYPPFTLSTPVLVYLEISCVFVKCFICIDSPC